MKHIFRALRSRNYFLFFTGQGVSLVGTWMQQTAMIWLVYRLTGSAFWLGVVGFTSQVPTFLFTPLAGVWVDRSNRYRLLILTQTLSLVQASILAVLTLTHSVTVWHLIVLGFILGSINAVDIPARQSFVIEMVEKREDLANAIALNSSLVNAARLIGPSLAGVLIAWVGEGVCFLMNALSFMAVLAALLAMNIHFRPLPVSGRSMWVVLKEGFAYVIGSEPIRLGLGLLALTGFMGTSYTVLMPVFATRILHGGPNTLGFLMAASGLGALTGALYLASRQSVVGLARLTALASALFGMSLVGFSFSHIFWLSLPMMVLAGFGFMVQTASTNTVLQTIVEEDKRGRLMSFFTMAFIGSAPLGSLLAGSLASRIGAPATVRIGGSACLLGALGYASRLSRIRQHIRPIYAKLGIIPAVARGIRNASGPPGSPGS